MLNNSAGTKFLHVPYKGVAPVLAALTGNEIQLSVGSSGVAGGLLKTGKVKALALAAKERSPLFPDVPTTTEMGHPEIQAFIWFGLAAPAGTPQPIVDKISADVREIVAQPAFTERFIATPGWKTYRQHACRNRRDHQKRAADHPRHERGRRRQTTVEEKKKKKKKI